MYKTIKANKDAYVTDRVVAGVRKQNANTGHSATLNLFKLYGATLSGSNPNIELSRLLVQFDLTDLRELVSEGRLDVNSTSFNCNLMLFDVYGGQPTPNKFIVSVNPLSKSFDEGLGRDVVLYGDNDTCNFLTASQNSGHWFMSGANLGGLAHDAVDYITSAIINNVTTSMGVEQFFATGEEDLVVDVTHIISSTLAGDIPDSGFRLAFTSSIETDTKTYFVKRFASRHAYNVDKRPKLIIKYDDSIQDDSNNFYVNSPATLFFYNYIAGELSNVTSGSSLTPVTGQDSLMLKLITSTSSGSLEYSFSGSQHTIGFNNVTGIYSASIFVPSNDLINENLTASGSISFTPVWHSLDGTVSFLSGSVIKAYPPQRNSTSLSTKRFVVSVTNTPVEVSNNENIVFKLNIASPSAVVTTSKTPIIASSLMFKNVFYGIRDVESNAMIIPFDVFKGSTRVSSDDSSMYFVVDTSNLSVGKSYVIDVLIKLAGVEVIHKSVCSPFRVI